MTDLYVVDGSGQDGDSSVPNSLEEAVRLYMPLVRHAVNRVVAGGLTSTILDRDDLISYGIQGLIEAYHGFDCDRGVKFSTYALPRIRGSVLDALRKFHPLPRSLQRASADIETASNELASDLGRSPTGMELADRLGITRLELERLSSAVNVKTMSLEVVAEMTVSGSTEKLIEMADDDSSGRPDAAVEQHFTRNQLLAAIERLPARERTIIRLYYLETRPLKSIAAMLGVSESRVSQLRHRAIRILRFSMSSEAPQAA